MLVFGPMEIIKLLLPGMRERGGGLIVNVTSLAAFLPIPYMGGYSAAKAALSSLSWTLDMELCREPIRIVDLRPADIRTNFHKTMECDDAAKVASSTDNIARAYGKYTENMENAPTPEGVAGLVRRIVESRGWASPRQNAGGIFQSVIAPVLAKLGPHAWTRSVLRKYYRLNCTRS